MFLLSDCFLSIFVNMAAEKLRFESDIALKRQHSLTTRKKIKSPNRDKMLRILFARSLEIQLEFVGSF